MNRVVWLNDGFVEPPAAALSIDDPGLLFGEGLFETMRGQDGRIPWLDRHLARLSDSIADLSLDGMPDPSLVAIAARRVAEHLGPGAARIRVTVTPQPTLVVTGTSIELDGDVVVAISIGGAWHPDDRIAEHKSLSRMAWRVAERQADAAKVDAALLLDADGCLGEATTANVFCVVGGRLITAPARGLLPGVTRGVVMEHFPVHEAVLTAAEWRSADEMFMTSAVRGVIPLGSVDGRAVGSGREGPETRTVRNVIDSLLMGQT